jgi:hypothetical protein
MRLPTVEDTRLILEQEVGPDLPLWIRHSFNVGQAAQIISSHMPSLDPDVAFRLGCLHDIGRRDREAGMRHVVVGYQYMLGLGYPDAARICITHAFPVKDVRSIYGEWDCTAEEVKFVQDFLDAIDYTDYDRLVQLCDAVSLSSGYCMLEKRMVDTALRRGITQHILPRWRALLDIRAYFDQQIGCPIYDILPGVIKNSLE